MGYPEPATANPVPAPADYWQSSYLQYCGKHNIWFTEYCYLCAGKNSLLLEINHKLDEILTILRK